MNSSTSGSPPNHPLSVFNGIGSLTMRPMDRAGWKPRLRLEQHREDDYEHLRHNLLKNDLICEDRSQFALLQKHIVHEKEQRYSP